MWSSISQQLSPAHHLSYGSIICHYFIIMSRHITSANKSLHHQFRVLGNMTFEWTNFVSHRFQIHIFLLFLTDAINGSLDNGSVHQEEGAVANQLGGQCIFYINFCMVFCSVLKYNCINFLIICFLPVIKK